VPRVSRAGLLIALSTGLVSLFGCSSAPAFVGPGPVRTICLSPVQSGQMVDIKEGQRILIRLPEGPKGYKWAVSRPPKPSVLGSVICTACPVSAAWADTASVEYSFQAVGPGMTDLELIQQPPGGGPATASFVLTVRVTYY